MAWHSNLKVGRGGRIVSVAVIIAVGVNTDGRREVLGMKIGTSEAEAIWVEFLRKLTRRGLRGVKLVVSDAHEGIKAAISKVTGYGVTVQLQVRLKKQVAVNEDFLSSRRLPKSRRNGFLPARQMRLRRSWMTSLG